MNNQFKVYHPADQTRHTVKARTVVRALVEAFKAMVDDYGCKVDLGEVKGFVDASISYRRDVITTVDFSWRKEGKTLEGLLMLECKPKARHFKLSFSPDKVWKLPGDFSIKVSTAKKEPKKTDWREMTDPQRLLKAFPLKPTANEIIELHAKVKALRSNLLDQFLREKARGFRP
jgi:hypothetical protein